MGEANKRGTQPDWADVVSSERKYHFAKHFSERGVSALGFPKPRAIDLKRAAWTIRASAVTCEKCLKILKERGPIQPDKKESGE